MLHLLNRLVELEIGVTLLGWVKSDLIEGIDDTMALVGNEVKSIIVLLEGDVNLLAELVLVELKLNLEDTVDKVSLETLVTQVNTELLERVDLRGIWRLDGMVW